MSGFPSPCIGVLAVIALIIFSRMAKRWSDMNAYRHAVAGPGGAAPLMAARETRRLDVLAVDELQRALSRCSRESAAGKARRLSGE